MPRDEDGAIWQYVGENSLTEQCCNDDVDFIWEEEQEEFFPCSYMMEYTIGKASDIETDILLKLNGVEDGIIIQYSYLVDIDVLLS